MFIYLLVYDDRKKERIFFFSNQRNAGHSSPFILKEKIK